MPKYKLEYIWLDGYTPLASLRSKTQIKEFASFPKLADLPLWGFDGSSTQQAEGKNSDCILKPVAVYPDITRKDGVLVMCEVMMPDGKTAHPSNSRATIPDDPGTWFGFEQEYFFYKDGAPLGFPPGGFPPPQGPYYTGVGYKNVGAIARKMVEEHIDICLAAGINHANVAQVLDLVVFAGERALVVLELELQRDLGDLRRIVVIRPLLDGQLVLLAIGQVEDVSRREDSPPKNGAAAQRRSARSGQPRGKYVHSSECTVCLNKQQ